MLKIALERLLPGEYAGIAAGKTAYGCYFMICFPFRTRLIVDLRKRYPIVSPTDHYPRIPMVSLHQNRMRLARIRNWVSEMVEMESTTRRENSTVRGGR